MWRDLLLFDKWNRRVPWVDAVARILNLRDGSFAARVDDSNPAYFLVWLTGCFQYLRLPREHLIFVLVLELANDLVLGAGRIAAAVEIHDIPAHKLRGGRRLKASSDVVGIRQDVFADESSAIKIGIGRLRNALNRKAVRRRCGSFGSLDSAQIWWSLPPCRRCQQ